MAAYTSIVMKWCKGKQTMKFLSIPDLPFSPHILAVTFFMKESILLLTDTIILRLSLVGVRALSGSSPSWLSGWRLMTHKIRLLHSATADCSSCSFSCRSNKSSPENWSERALRAACHCVIALHSFSASPFPKASVPSLSMLAEK